MRSKLIRLLFGVAIVVVAGCSSVTTQQPLSSEPKPIDQAAFEGAWQADDQILHIRFSSDGVGHIAGIGWEDNQFRMELGEMIVAEGDKHNFLSARFREEGKWPDEYLLAAYTFTDQNDLVIWTPDPDAFEEMITKKHLQGVVDKEKYGKSITLTDDPAKILEYLKQTDDLKAFDYRSPIVLRKIAGTE